MQRFFERPPAGDPGSERDTDRDNTLIDWTVLLSGVLMLALSVAPAVTDKAEKISDDTLDRVAPEEDWLPS